jgi:protein-tyrosine phosphatase
VIDLHTHILPGIDDGAVDDEMAIRMLGQAQDDGITAMAATPHFVPGSFAPHAEAVKTAVRRLSEKARANGIDLRISAAHEVRAGAGLVDRLKRGEILAFDPKRRYLLVEMPGTEVPEWMDRLLFELEVADLIPVLAHPERNGGVMRDPVRLYSLVRRGCLVQVTADSLRGRFGKSVQQTAETILLHDMAHMVVSDAHDDVDRRPVLSEARAMVEKLVGPAVTLDLFVRNPERILEGIEFEPPEPRRPETEEAPSPLLDLMRRIFGFGS